MELRARAKICLAVVLSAAQRKWKERRREKGGARGSGIHLSLLTQSELKSFYIFLFGEARQLRVGLRAVRGRPCRWNAAATWGARRPVVTSLRQECGVTSGGRVRRRRRAGMQQQQQIE